MEAVLGDELSDPEMQKSVSICITMSAGQLSEEGAKSSR
jgi:hypothetical protein